MSGAPSPLCHSTMRISRMSPWSEIKTPWSDMKRRRLRGARASALMQDGRDCAYKRVCSWFALRMSDTSAFRCRLMRSSAAVAWALMEVAALSSLAIKESKS